MTNDCFHCNCKLTSILSSFGNKVRYASHYVTVKVQLVAFCCKTIFLQLVMCFFSLLLVNMFNHIKTMVLKSHNFVIFQDN